MPDYKTGKIYKICDVNQNLIYVGSTTKTLAQRMAEHRSRYKNRKKSVNWSVFKIFDEYGIDRCRIYLIELFPCNSRDELSAREGHFILNLICVNKNVAGRGQKDSKQHWRDTHKAQIKQHRIDTADQIKKYRNDYKPKLVQWRIDNKDKIKESNRQYRLKKKLEKQNQSLATVEPPISTPLINCSII